jgi:DNA-directed RNA polymerase specialized sigma24 family protein
VEWEAYEAGVLAPPTDDEWLEYFQPDEDPTVGDVTEDRTALSPEASYAGRELMDHVHRILGQLPRSWRHALTLYTVEGFELAEVAASLEAPADVVLDRIAMATRFLRDKLEEGGYSRPRRLASPDRPVLR